MIYLVNDGIEHLDGLHYSSFFKKPDQRRRTQCLRGRRLELAADITASCALYEYSNNIAKSACVHAVQKLVFCSKTPRTILHTLLLN